MGQPIDQVKHHKIGVWFVTALWRVKSVARISTPKACLRKKRGVGNFSKLSGV